MTFPLRRSTSGRSAGPLPRLLFLARSGPALPRTQETHCEEEADDLNECLVPRSGGSLGLRSFEEVFETEGFGLLVCREETTLWGLKQAV